jgi:hypothetical protein
VTSLEQLEEWEQQLRAPATGGALTLLALNAIPQLLAEVRRLSAENLQLREQALREHEFWSH